jgi:hypothetical protein
MGLYPEQLYEMVLFFRKKSKKTPYFFFGTLLNGLQHIFGFGHRLGLALQNGFDSFPKTTNKSTKWFVVFFSKMLTH